ncbi:AraC family transcriptional regulator [Marinicella meishanensis]|uniref:AraC family transcriptional regulator n=1 Tax=Marinicella meishanensis TaxID=2873263 RepID=UPI001CBD9EAD|nr:DUF6597 domain-containing transcriptional factor [Marinicella sp. NBU2979]
MAKPTYQEFRPTKALQQMVEACWYFEPQFKQAQPDILVPEGVVDVIFNLGEPYFRQAIGPGDAAGQWVAEDVLVGQRNCLFKIIWPQQTRLFAIRLNPGHAHRCTQHPMAPLTNQTIALQQTHLSVLSAQLRSADVKDPKALVQICQRVLPEVVGPPALTHPNIQAALNLIDQHQGKIDVQKLSDALRITRRTLERQFKKLIGLTPKFYLRAKRLHYFLCSHKSQNNVLDAALQADYYDQSHFIKEFKTFTGETPQAFFASPPEIYEPLMQSLITKLHV